MLNPGGNRALRDADLSTPSPHPPSSSSVVVVVVEAATPPPPCPPPPPSVGGGGGGVGGGGGGGGSRTNDGGDGDLILADALAEAVSGKPGGALSLVLMHQMSIFLYTKNGGSYEQ